MKFLLDTHVFLWVAGQEKRLPDRLHALFENTEAELTVSVISAWEISIKKAVGKLSFDLERFVLMSSALRLRLLSLEVAHCIEAAALPLHHRDPFDRMMVAQARVEGLTLVTADRALAAYDVPLLAATG